MYRLSTTRLIAVVARQAAEGWRNTALHCVVWPHSMAGVPWPCSTCHRMGCCALPSALLGCVRSCLAQRLSSQLHNDVTEGWRRRRQRVSYGIADVVSRYPSVPTAWWMAISGRVVYAGHTRVVLAVRRCAVLHCGHFHAPRTLSNAGYCR